MEFREMFYVCELPAGGIGYIVEEGHQYFQHNLAFYAWFDHEVNIPGENASFQALICKSPPIIEPRPGERFFTWVANPEMLCTTGFVTI